MYKRQGAGGDVLAWLLLDVELDPFTAVWVNGSGYQLMLGEVTKSVSLTRLEDHTRRSNQLANYNTLGAVDHERAAICLLYTSPSPRDRG